MSMQEFYQEMARAYQAQTGAALHEASDPAIRFRVLAEQLELLEQRLERAYRQAFPATAGGEALEFHAAARGLERKPATCAQGRVRFLRAAAGAEAMLPPGMVCETADGIQFETVEEAVFQPDSLEAFANAQAVLPGSGGNIPPEKLVRCRDSAYTVRNPWAFTGGCDQEDDRQLRRRLLASWAGQGNGANGAYYRALALEEPGIEDAVVCCDDARNITIYVAARDKPVPTATLAALAQRLQPLREPCSTVNVEGAAIQVVEVAAQVEPVGEIGPAAAALEALLRERINVLPIAGRLTRAALCQWIMESGLAKNCQLLTPAADVYATAGTVLRAGAVTITQMGGAL